MPAAVPTPLVSPMLATLGGLPTGAPWAYEFKWDGVRAISYTDDHGLRMFSRNDRDITAAYPELAELTDLVGRRRVVLDGEVVALDERNRPSFARLQQRMHVRTPSPALMAAIPVIYHVFDVLNLDGAATLDEPYHRRRDLLAELDLGGDAVRVPPHFVEVDGANVMTAAQASGLEGVVAKRLTSGYQPGRRSRDWIKVPFNPTQEVVIIGYKPGEGRRAGTIGSLLLAVSTPDGGLSFAGGVGTGFTATMLRDLLARLGPLTRTDPPVEVPREHARGARWVLPAVVGEVAYRTWTPDGRLRHASWRGLRPDKTIAQTHRVPTPPPAVAQVEGAMQTPDGGWRIEVVRGASARWYRIVHGDDVIDWLSITGVERILGGAGIDMSQLTPTRLRAEVEDRSVASSRNPGDDSRPAAG
jgi:bifunctional non-homologous end joining protein LigD